MNKIIKFFTKIISKEPPKPMGRWNIDYCNIKMNNKIDLSNEDHCGPCGHYAITKMNTQYKNNHNYTNKVQTETKIK